MVVFNDAERNGLAVGVRRGGADAETFFVPVAALAAAATVGDIVQRVAEAQAAAGS